MPLPEATLVVWLYAFARLAGWATFDPLAGRLPRLLRLGLAATLALALLPGLGAAPGATLQASILPALVLEFAWGAALSLCVWIVFALAQAVLHWVGHSATGGLLALTDAQAETSDAPWRALAGWMAALAFLGAGGHLLVVSALRDSFAAMPVAMLPDADTLRTLAESAGWLFATGAQLAVPLLALALLIQLALGIVARTTPGLDMFSVGLGLAAIGLLAAWVAAAPVLAAGVRAAFEQLAFWLGLLGAR